MSVSRRNDILLIAVLGLIASGIFAALSGYIVPGPDEAHYDTLGYNLAAGHGFSLSKTAPFIPTMFREPGYPVFLAALYAVFGHSRLIVVLAQMFLHSLTAVLIYHFAAGIFTGRAALICGICVAIFPTLASASAYLLSETFFTFLLCAGVYAFSSGVRRGKPGICVVAGFAFAALTLTKAAAVFMPFTLAGTAVIIAMERRVDLKRLCTGLALCIAVYSMVVAGWMLRNNAHFSTFSITLRGGEALWSRAQKLDDPPKEVLADACYNFSEYCGARFFPNAAVKAERYLFRDFEKAEALRAAYARQGMNDPQIEDIFRKEAMAKISRKPFKYAAYTFIEWIKMASFTYLPVLNEARVKAYFGPIEHGGVILSAARGAMRALAYPILAFFIIGCILHSKMWDRWILLFVAVAYFNIVYSLLDAIGRYGVPLIPFYCVMATGFFFPVRKTSGEDANV